MMSLPWLYGVVAAGLFIAMAGAWAIQRATRNAGWVDVVWSASVGLGGASAAVTPWPEAADVSTRQLVVAGLALLWALRLATHIARRTISHPEDARYARFRIEWGPHFERRLFMLLMIQAAAAACLVVSIMVAARNPAPGLRATDWAGILLLLGALLGETIADRQMRTFRDEVRRGVRPGGVCERGLWAWSCHPNYFFEWLCWCAYPCISIDFDGTWWPGVLALTGPAFMFWLLRYVSGVPPLEAAMLESRGDEFRDYQRRVSVFVPLPPSTT